MTSWFLSCIFVASRSNGKVSIELNSYILTTGNEITKKGRIVIIITTFKYISDNYSWRQ